MELIAHAVKLCRANKPQKFKFVILHLANSVELILKDLLIDKGESIYKPNSLKLSASGKYSTSLLITVSKCQNVQ
jgi:hypothetical protein